MGRFDNRDIIYRMQVIWKLNCNNGPMHFMQCLTVYEQLIFYHYNTDEKVIEKHLH